MMADQRSLAQQGGGWEHLLCLLVLLVGDPLPVVPLPFQRRLLPFLLLLVRRVAGQTSPPLAIGWGGGLSPPRGRCLGPTEPWLIRMNVE